MVVRRAPQEVRRSPQEVRRASELVSARVVRWSWEVPPVGLALPERVGLEPLMAAEAALQVWGLAVPLTAAALAQGMLPGWLEPVLESGLVQVRARASSRMPRRMHLGAVTLTSIALAPVAARERAFPSVAEIMCTRELSLMAAVRCALVDAFHALPG